MTWRTAEALGGIANKEMGRGEEEESPRHKWTEADVFGRNAIPY